MNTMKARPKCPACGKGVGRRATMIEEQYLPNGKLPLWRRDPDHPEDYVLKMWSHPNGSEQTKHLRELWDGESFHSPASKPFCGNPCAIRFARAAYNSGWRKS